MTLPPTGWNYQKALIVNYNMWAHNAIPVKEWDIYWVWEILYEVEKVWKRRIFNCKCVCGSTKIIQLHQLRMLLPKSCGCIKNKWAFKHWMKDSPMYKKWKYMRERCSSKAPHKIKAYTNKWVKVCEEWNDFIRFYEDMKLWFSPTLELDRVDNDKWYHKENCRWTTKSENCKNRWTKIQPLPQPPTK